MFRRSIASDSNVFRKYLFSMSSAIRCYAGPSTSKRTHYDVLGVSPTASAAEIRTAYVKLSKKYHPDLNPQNKEAHEQFVEINEAYSVLSKTETRREYDTRSGGPRFGNGHQDHSRGDPTAEMYRQFYEDFLRQTRAKPQRPPRNYPRYDEWARYEPPRDSWRQDPFRGRQQEDPFEKMWRQHFSNPPKQQQQMDQGANKAFFSVIRERQMRESTDMYKKRDIDAALHQWENVVITKRDEEPNDGNQWPPKDKEIHRA